MSSRDLTGAFVKKLSDPIMEVVGVNLLSPLWISRDSPLRFLLFSFAGFLATILVLQKWLHWQRRQQGYKRIPGFSILETLKVIRVAIENPRIIMDHFCDSLLKHGDICKIPLLFENFVFLMKPEYVQALFSSNDSEYLNKSAILYRVVFEVTGGNDLFTSPVHLWKWHRKILSKAFTYKYLKHYTVTYFNPHSKQLVAKLENLYIKDGSSTICQLNDHLNICALDIICKIIIGGGRYLPAENCQALYESMKNIKKLAFKRLTMPWLLFDEIWKLHSFRKEYQVAADRIDRQVKKAIEIEKNVITAITTTSAVESKDSICDGNNNDDEVIKESFEGMMTMMKNSEMSDEDILANLKSMIVGGYETSASTAHFLLFMLAVHPEHQIKCREEVDRLFADSSLVTDGNISFAGLSELKHLEKCCLETLRLHPIIGIFGRKIRKPLKLDKSIELPSGTNVMVYVPSVHKNPRIYPNPEKFDPERFSAENCKSRNLYAFLSFSTGTRNCIGYKFAMAEIKTMVAHIVRNFEIFTTDQMGEIPLLLTIVLSPERDYNFILKKRNFK